ncbi:acetyl esterase/lipase [Sediminihabitans luteus]|uniref:Acetyl esterase/lipase n=1 Tax=Sediminihabitans luteus TaxID=1138585 RepID=A0A2M9CC79_9CELL|nr:alpha/beta hydrolase fold domain-containing protein [Sediminihabitans luteus]PJJ68620.1 acetyl esterase/lipase [Sediminihabitans luteus]GII99959.1 esterase [Sediminihabitans luteus]
MSDEAPAIPPTDRPTVRTHEATVPSVVDVPVRVYVPEPAGAPPGVLVWAHGGGFVHGGLDMPESDALARGIAAQAGVVVVAVDYELAGDGRGYPVPHTQLRDVLAWTRAQAAGWGADPATVAAGGASAGACVVLGATLSLLDDGLPLPARLLLAYPAAHRVLRRDPSLAPPAQGPDPVSRFDDERMASMFGTYANGVDPAPYLSVDGRDLTGMPPMLVHAALLDDLRTSAEDLVARAVADGVEARLHVADAGHGYLNHDPAGHASSATVEAFARTF